MRILVAEDEKKVAAFIADGLVQEGYAVDVDGEDALQKAESVEYDAAVLDWMLPTRSGLDVLRAIRSKKSSLPVLIKKPPFRAYSTGSIGQRRNR